MPPYPWTGRPVQQKASNDGSFPGFILVGPIDFTVTPSRRTPGAQINVSITFGLPYPEEAEDQLIFELTAPLGYLFQPSCLAERNLFRKCIPNGHRASLEPVSRRANLQMNVNVTVQNPQVTPIPNWWTVQLF